MMHGRSYLCCDQQLIHSVPVNCFLLTVRNGLSQVATASTVRRGVIMEGSLSWWAKKDLLVSTIHPYESKFLRQDVARTGVNN